MNNKKNIAKVGILGVVLLGITECSMIVAPAVMASQTEVQSLSIEPHFGIVEQILDTPRFNRLEISIEEDAYPWLNPENVNKQISPEELKSLLRKVGFEGYGLQMAQAIVFLESTRKYYAHNQNDNTGDNSYGLFQINMFRGLEAARLEKYNLENNEELFDPITNARIAYQISNGGNDWSAWTTYQKAKKILSNYSY